MLNYEERQSSQREIEKIIKNFSYRELSALSTAFKKKEFQKIEKDISNYLLEFNALKAQLMSVSLLTNQAYKNENVQKYVTYKHWRQQHSDIKLDLILKKGYILIEQLRLAFTGKEIKYIVGFEGSVSRGNRQLVNKEISLAELLSYSYIDINWGGSASNIFKLRASASAADFQREYNVAQRLAQRAFSTHSHSLYLIVTKAVEGKYHKTNAGNVYETYWNLRHKGYPDKSDQYSMNTNPTNPDIDEILDAYQQVRRGTQSFVTGGDWGSEQYKLLTKSPSIASMTTIENSLKFILQQLIAQKSAVITEEGIKNIFSTEFDNLVRTQADSVIDEVDAYLQNLTK